jgi:di/tricarboxylate transporter
MSLFYLDDKTGEKAAVRMQEAEPSKPQPKHQDSPHASEEEDFFDYDEFDLPLNQRTFTSINQLSMNPRSYQPYNTVGPYGFHNNQMTVTSIGSLNPANDPDSMVAFLPNVRLNSMDRGAGQDIDPRSRFRRRNTMEREPMREHLRERKNSRLEKISLLSKEEILSQPGDDIITVTVDKDVFDTKEEAERNFLLLGIAYAANIGGTGVITGSPPNLVVPDTLSKMFGPNTGLTFASWMAFAIPIMLVNSVLAWLWLQQVQKWELRGKSQPRTKAQEERAMRVITEKYHELGRMSLHEIQVFILFSILLILWFFQSPKFMIGWADLFIEDTVRGSRVTIGAATPAILTILFLFILPQTYDFPPFSRMTPGCLQNSPSLITWRLIETKMCWGVIFLLGGGFALASASQKSGLSSLLVEQLERFNLTALPQPILIGVVCLLTVSITNIASNTATANVLVPILSEMAITMCVNPIYLTLPAGIVCSYAFALPVATAPNAIVFGHSTLRTTDMMKAGLVMNIICVFTIVLAINSYAIPLFGLNEFPDWASVKLANASMCNMTSS